MDEKGGERERERMNVERTVGRDEIRNNREIKREERQEEAEVTGERVCVCASGKESVRRLTGSLYRLSKID